MQTFSLNGLLTSIHYLHSPLWGLVLHTMNALSLLLAVLYATSPKNSIKMRHIFIIIQIIYFIILIADALIYGPFILRIGSEYFYEFILELVRFNLPIILVIIVSKRKREEASIAKHK